MKLGSSSALVRIALLLGLLAGCSGAPRDTIKEDLKAALLVHESLLLPCFSVAGGWGAREHQYPVAYPHDSTEDIAKLHELLSTVGLETRTLEKRAERGVPLVGAPKQIDWAVYSPTESGKKILFKEQSAMASGYVMCVGQVRNLSIDSYIEPVLLPVGKITKVSFSYTVEALPDWYESNLSILSRLTNNRNLGPKFTDIKVDLVLTNGGWERADQLKSPKMSREAVYP